jgi:predicted RNA-binding Zn ribbon-like protein
VVDGRWVDDIRSPEGLIFWLEGVGLADSSGTPELRSPPLTRILLAETHALRDHVDRLVEALTDQAPVPAYVLDGLNRLLAASRISTQLHEGSGKWALAELEEGEGPLAMLAPVARAAAALATETDPERVRRCASESCSLWFTDTSKGGRRKWCSMATCGNRAKAAKHRLASAGS